MSYTIKTHITNIDFNDEEITVEYNFSKSELGHLDGTGTFDGVQIKKVLLDTVDVTKLIHSDYIEYIELDVLDKHLDNGL